MLTDSMKNTSKGLIKHKKQIFIYSCVWGAKSYLNDFLK